MFFLLYILAAVFGDTAALILAIESPFAIVRFVSIIFALVATGFAVRVIYEFQ